MGRSGSKTYPSFNERLEVVETVVSGQNISISLEYDLRDAETVNHVVVQTKFFGVFWATSFRMLVKKFRPPSPCIEPRHPSFV
jgi:hypothetical protein